MKLDGITQPKAENRKNYIINGDMAISQRGTSFAAAGNGVYTLDRWRHNNNTSAANTVSQDSDVPTVAQAGYKLNSSLKVDVTTADASIAAGDLMFIDQPVEGYNWAQIAQKPITLSFWVKATKTGTYCVSVGNNVDRSYVVEYTVSVTDTWELKTVSISASPSAGTWNYTNGTGLRVVWTLAAGTNFHTASPNSWQSALNYATANQVNGLDNTANNFWLTGVMLNGGTLAAPFSLFAGGGIGAELTVCERYYEICRTGAGNSNANTIFGGNNATSAETSMQFNVQKRTSSPTVTIPSGGYQINNKDGPIAVSSLSSAVQDAKSCRLTVIVAGGIIAGSLYNIFRSGSTFDIIVDAEL